MEQIVLWQLGDDGILTVVTHKDKTYTVDVNPLGGPGVWRRVLSELESRGVEDRNHKLLAWKFDLIGEWHY